MSRNRGLFGRSQFRTIPRDVPVEFVPRTEHEEARRATRDWLRDRSEDDAIDFEDGESDGY